MSRKLNRFDEFIAVAGPIFGDATVAWKEITEMCKDKNLVLPATGHFTRFKMGRGVYNFGADIAPVPVVPVSPATPAGPVNSGPIVTSGAIEVFSSVEEDVNFIPHRDMNFIPFGVSADLKKIIQSKQFLPTWINGDTGYGKTFTVEQLAVRANREVIRVNCTPDTDESELIGDFILRNGDMIWHNGPVLEAMNRGAILLLDEVDALDPKRGAFPLYSLLEGSGVFVKKLNKRFFPAKGFTVLATANTKGKGSVDGRYLGVNGQNDAFLDRFTVTLTHGAPSPAVEKRILNLTLPEDDNFCRNLTAWASIIRKTFNEGGCDVEISTRRMVNICKLYRIFKDRVRSIAMSIEKWDSEIVESFLELYGKVDAGDEEVSGAFAEVDIITDEDGNVIEEEVVVEEVLVPDTKVPVMDTPKVVAAPAPF